MTRRLTSLLLLAAALAAAGCASVASFHLPDEFKDGKQKEDPPGVYLPPADGVRPC